MWGVAAFLCGVGFGVVATLIGAIVYIDPVPLPPATERQIRKASRADIRIALNRPGRPAAERRRLPVIRSVDLAVAQRPPAAELGALDLDGWDREDTHG